MSNLKISFKEFLGLYPIDNLENKLFITDYPFRYQYSDINLVNYEGLTWFYFEGVKKFIKNDLLFPKNSLDMDNESVYLLRYKDFDSYSDTIEIITDIIDGENGYKFGQFRSINIHEKHTWKLSTYIGWKRIY